MSNVETFKYYASQLNLTKPQLEAVTDCFKACFEADANGVEPINPKVQDETTPSEKRKPQVSFSEGDHLHTFPENELANLLKTKNARLSKVMNGKGRAPQVNAKDQNRVMKYGSNALAENFANTVDMEEKRQAENAAQRQKVMNLQRELNKALGINLAVDGVKGPQTIAAEKRYKAMLAGNKQYAANQSNETANSARIKYAGTPKPVASDTEVNVRGNANRPAPPSTGNAVNEQNESLPQKYWELNQKYNPLSPRNIKEAWDWWTK